MGENARPLFSIDKVLTLRDGVDGTPEGGLGAMYLHGLPSRSMGAIVTQVGS